MTDREPLNDARSYLGSRIRQVFDAANAERPRWTVQDAQAVEELLANVSTCRACGHSEARLIQEVEDQLLERCPVCGAYDWFPDPVFQPSRGSRRGTHD